MPEIVMTASEANRSFSRLLRLVAEGAKVRVTSHGRTVAVVQAPEEEAGVDPARAAALAARRARWATQPPVTIAPWTRDELYERD